MKRVLSTQRHEEEWRKAFAANHETLLETANILLPCGGCAELVVKQSERHVLMLDIPEAFKYGFLLRTIVKFAFEHVHEQERTAAALPPRKDWQNPIQELPFIERFVYYLTDVLRYPARDVALLTGLGNSEREEMLGFARRRLVHISELHTSQISRSGPATAA